MKSYYMNLLQWADNPHEFVHIDDRGNAVRVSFEGATCWQDLRVIDQYLQTGLYVHRTVQITLLPPKVY